MKGKGPVEDCCVRFMPDDPWTTRREGIHRTASSSRLVTWAPCASDSETRSKLGDITFIRNRLVVSFSPETGKFFPTTFVQTNLPSVRREETLVLLQGSLLLSSSKGGRHTLLLLEALYEELGTPSREALQGTPRPQKSSKEGVFPSLFQEGQGRQDTPRGDPCRGERQKSMSG